MEKTNIKKTHSTNELPQSTNKIGDAPITVQRHIDGPSCPSHLKLREIWDNILAAAYQHVYNHGTGLNSCYTFSDKIHAAELCMIWIHANPVILVTPVLG